MRWSWHHLNLGLSLADSHCPITVHPRSPVTSSYTTWLMQHTLHCTLHFVPTLHQLMHLESLQVSELSSKIEDKTWQQSKCPVWTQLWRPKLTASCFWHACSSRAGSAEQESAAVHTIRGSTMQTAAMIYYHGTYMNAYLLLHWSSLYQSVLPSVLLKMFVIVIDWISWIFVIVIDWISCFKSVINQLIRLD